jgi:uncharacterized SAM-binding protein YcdF (DUF218 family)
LAFLLAAFTPAMHVVGGWLIPERSALPAEAIVVLGGGGVAPGGGLTDTSLRGVMEGVALYREGWAPILVLSGGGDGRTRSEAEARADFARLSGVPATAIVTAAPARTTREEAVQLQALLQPRGVRKILLVVDGPGMVRAMAVFERVGFQVVPAPWNGGLPLDASPEDRLALLRAIAMEVVARLYYRVLGYV